MNNGPGRLFDKDAFALAAEHHGDSHFRWLALSSDPAASALRRVLADCWLASGHSRLTLRKGLQHERWGQHIGALAQLLSLGFFRRLGLSVESEPRLARRTPDLCIAAGECRALVEVRALTGCGERPWEHPLAHSITTKPGVTDHDGHRAGQVVPRHLQRSRARRRAAAQAEAQAEARAALDVSLADSLARALHDKAAAYRDLCAHRQLPYVICLYQDTDTQIARRVLDWAFGASPSPRKRDRRDAREPGNGAFARQSAELAHVSAVLVLGRVESCEPREPRSAHRDDDLGATVNLRGELILNPLTLRPLPTVLSPAPLRVFACPEGHGSASWNHDAAPTVEL